MKDMITTIASIMILMIFVLQFVTNQITYTKLAGSGSYVKQFEHIAVEAGEVSAENIQNLRRNAAQVLNCLPDEIHIDVKEAESETYVYDVRVPLKNIIGAAKMLGMNHNTVRKGLQQGVFPWGYGIRTSENRWVYFINAKRFAEIEGIAF